MNWKVKIDLFTDDVIRIFKANRKFYGTRRIKKELEKEDKILPRRRIRRIMKENALVSVYTVANYKVISLLVPTTKFLMLLIENLIIAKY